MARPSGPVPPLVSCIVPVFNGERFLREALESLLSQTYRPIEILVVDDGSTDGTPAVAAAYGEVIRYVVQPSLGCAAARNRGLREGRGALVAFLDADDLWHHDKLARQVARFVARPELDYCVTYVRNFRGSALPAEAGPDRDHRPAEPLPGYVTGSLMARRSAFERIGLFDPGLRHGDGADWFMRAAEQGAVMELVPEVLTHRRVHEGNLSRRRADESRAEFLRVVRASLVRRRRGGGVPPRPYEFPA